MFEEKTTITLLDIIKHNRDIFSLLELGLEVAQIPRLLKQAQTMELIKKYEDGISLTEKGEKLLNLRSKVAHRRKMIVPKIEARIEKQGAEVVYLPQKIVHY